MGLVLKVLLLLTVQQQSGTATVQSLVEMNQLSWEKEAPYIQSGEETFAFASYYSDHMVLQRAPKRAVLWGYSPTIGETITVKLSDRGTYTTNVYRDPQYGNGVWKIKLLAESNTGPFTITAISSEKTITLNDVMFGDVWLCSGQSNMVFTMIQVFNATAEIEDANNFPYVRLFTVAEISSAIPVPDLMGAWQNWSLANSSTVGGAPWKYFSAVCWLYGKALFKELGYPIGLIDTTWGGTVIEAWSSPEALAKCGLGKGHYSCSEEDFDSFCQKSTGNTTDTNGPNTNSNLWNSMIRPLLNMTIYGVIWYQGESNYNHNPETYSCTFPTMIDDWRLKFNGGSEGETDPMFPFGFVQIGPKDPDSTSMGFADIRWRQTANYGYVPNPRMQNVFMAVAVDLSDFASPWASVHIRDKQDVAARLTVSGLSVAYNDKRSGMVYHGPLPSHIVEGKNNISLIYNTTIKYNNYIGFEALCDVPTSVKTFWMELPIMSPLLYRIELWSGVCGQGQTILAIRYLWKESPCPFKTCTVYSAANPLLPGPPFILYKKMTNIAGTVHYIDWNIPARL